MSNHINQNVSGGQYYRKLHTDLEVLVWFLLQQPQLEVHHFAPESGLFQYCGVVCTQIEISHTSHFI